MKKPSLSALILIAMAAGILTGLFFGESCRHLEFIGRAFIALMQISVLPYIFVSLIQSFGSLEPTQSRLLAKRGSLMVVILWLIVFALISLMPLTFPNWQSASFYSPSMLRTPENIDYIQLFIPSNPFNALANNVVPAVTIFSILCGVMLMNIPQKAPLLQLLDTVSEVLSRLALFLVKFTPIGVFALVAKAAGTMYPEDLGRMEVYLGAYGMLAALLFFLVLPLILTALTPFGYRELMVTGRAAMLTVLLTGNLFIVLPLLVENVKTLFARHCFDENESRALARIVVPITFIVPCAGQLLDLLFVLFAAWFSNETFQLAQYLELYGAGLLALFGSAKVAIPFLLSMFRLPADLFEIFLVSSVITDNLKFAVEAFSILVLTMLFAAWMTGHLQFRVRRFWSRMLLIALGVALALVALQQGMTRLKPPLDQRHTLNAMKIAHPLPSKVFARLGQPEPGPADESRLDRIHRTGVLRVGFNPNVMPFSFFNDRGELIGFDIAMAHMLAAELGCARVEFYPVAFESLDEPLNNNQVDVVMSNVSINEKRLGKVMFTNHYLELSMALVIPDFMKQLLREDPKQINRRDFTVAALEGADYNRLENAYVRTRKVKLQSVDDFFSGKVRADALLSTAENGSAWTILYPEYDVFVPRRQFKDLIAYAVPALDTRFRDYLNYWLTLKRTNGDIDRGIEYWIKEVNVEPKPPRWSILRNVILRQNQNGL